MNKSTQKNSRYNTMATKKVAQQYGCSERYVRGSISGKYTGIKPDILKKAYFQMDKAINDTIEKFQNQ